MAHGPRLLGRREAPAVAEEEFGEPMARAEQIGADVLATAQQVAGGFFLLGGNVNGRQRAGAVEHRELAGVAAIGFDPVARAPRNQRRGDHVTGNPVRRERPLQLEAARARFVATASPRPGAAAAARSAGSSADPT